MNAKVTIFAIGVIVLVAAIALPGGTDATKHFHNCTFTSGSWNTPHLFDTAEVYSCDEGTVEIAGKTTETIEHGYVYTTHMGRFGTEDPHPATAFDYNSSKWCAGKNGQQERCGDKPVICWDGKIATWDENWQGYSCVTPDHDGKQAK